MMQRCYTCGQDTAEWTETPFPDPDNPGERQHALVCSNCDAGADALYLDCVWCAGGCSEDRIELWHGMDSPAVACGRHAEYDAAAVYRRHRERVAQ